MFTRRKLFAGLSSAVAALSFRSSSAARAETGAADPAAASAAPESIARASPLPALQFLADSPDAVPRPLQAKLKGLRSVFDFMTPAQEASARARNFALDLREPLQKAWNWAAANGYAIDLENAAYRINAPLVMPDGQSYAITGSGAAFAFDTKGAQIVLFGSGFDCIVRIGSSPRLKTYSLNRTLRGVALICDTQDGAAYGVKWAHTTFTQDAFYDVRVVKAKRGWGMFADQSANGEFVHLERCSANFTERFFYMDGTQATGQSFAHLFVNCNWLGDMRIASHGPRAAFEAGSANGGFSLMALNFNATVIRPDGKASPMDMPQASYLINNGMTGNFTSIGGRVEHFNTLLDNRATVSGGCSITFQGVDFGGLQSCDRHPAVKSSVDSEGGSRVKWDGCNFDLQLGGGAQCFNVLPHRFDGSEYVFERCNFVSSSATSSVDKLIVLRLASQPNSRIVMSGCLHAPHGTASKRLVDKLLENLPFGAGGGRSVSEGSPLAAAGVPSNLLRHPAFGTAANAGIAPAPWMHTGGGFALFGVYPDGRVAEFSSSPLARYVALRGGASVYQDIDGIRMASGAEAYYAAILEVVAGGQQTDCYFQASLENSATGETYDTVQLFQSAGPVHVYLSAVATGGSGLFRLRLQAVGNALCQVRLHHQRVTQKRQSAFVMPAPGETREFAQLWSSNPESLRVLSRLALPRKDDSTGSAAAALADLESDVYLSTVSEQLKFFANHKWNQLPNQDSGTAPPADGEWPEGWIRWNTARRAGGRMGWTCVKAGSPGTWKAWGAIDD